MYYMTYTGQQWLKQCLYFGVHPVSYHDIWVHFFSLWREKSLLQVFSGGKEDGSFCHLLLQNFWVFSCPRTRRASPISVAFGRFGPFSTLSPIVSWILFLFLSISISNFISISLESYLPFFFFNFTFTNPLLFCSYFSICCRVCGMCNTLQLFVHTHVP